ncbi:MAG: aromatic amino acid transport family protein [bacterium]|nr:aromatic amino acid transport family protein [bacterium]
MPDRPVVLHQGIYKKTATVGEAVFMITGMTIGAGILGVPYVVAQVGLVVGLVYILVLGIVMLYLNLIIGETAVRTGENLQLPGLAGKYLGPWAKGVVSAIAIFTGYGALLAYMVGEGQAIAALIGGDPLIWSFFFWSVGSFLIWRGLQTVKTVERILSLSVMIIITGLSVYLLRGFHPAVWTHFNTAKMFLPFGVILFALNAAPAIAEAHALLPGSQRHFKKAVILGTMIPVVLYLLFTLAVVGVTNGATTEVATVGLGQMFGPVVLIFANVFAILAMGTAFMGMGMALKQIFIWDYKMPKWVADVMVVIAPLGLFAWGVRGFVEILDAIGGIFVSLGSIILVLACYKARKKSELTADRYSLQWFGPIAVAVIAVFTFVMVYSIVKLFIK